MSCVQIQARRAVLHEKMMENLPEERVSPSTPPFAAVCIDLLGPVIFETIVNKRATMKAWSALMVCQGTIAMHIQLS